MPNFLEQLVAEWHEFKHYCVCPNAKSLRARSRLSADPPAAGSLDFEPTRSIPNLTRPNVDPDDASLIRSV